MFLRIFNITLICAYLFTGSAYLCEKSINISYDALFKAKEKSSKTYIKTASLSSHVSPVKQIVIDAYNKVPGDAVTFEKKFITFLPAELIDKPVRKEIPRFLNKAPPKV